MLTKFAELTVLSGLFRFRRLTRLTRLTIATSRLTDGVGGGQKSVGFGLAYRRGSHAQIFFPQLQLLNLFKRNQINQTPGFKGFVGSQADENIHLFSGARGRGRAKSLAGRERGPAAILRTQNCEIKYKKPTPGGRVKSLAFGERDRPASNAHLFANLRKLFFGPAVPWTHEILSRNSRGGGRRTPRAVTR